LPFAKPGHREFSERDVAERCPHDASGSENSLELDRVLSVISPDEPSTAV
jgi:hypothetical protein